MVISHPSRKKGGPYDHITNLKHDGEQPSDQEDTKSKANLIVHALLDGLPLCGFSRKNPNEWTPNHLWTNVSDLTNINCTECKKLAEKLSKRV